MSEAGGSEKAEQAATDGVDLTKLREKYAEERDRRIRSDGIGQFIEMAGDYRKYIKDPDMEGAQPRATKSDHVEVLVIGAGWNGMVTAVRLIQNGIEDFRILDNGRDFGGTWYWNRYPGVQCDIESYIYMPLLEEAGYLPTEKYAHGKEIQEHAQRVARQFGLYERTLFQTHLERLTWDESGKRWQVKTSRGDNFTARHVIMACGSLNRPKLPGIPGILDFKGKSFHTSRWDYEYTGGDTTGHMDKLADKRVALIGTGATGIQVAPFIAADAKHLYVVQRTPAAVGPRGNKPTDAEWAKSLGPGWHESRRSNFQKLVSGVEQEQDLVNDGWTEIMRILGAVFFRVNTKDQKTPEQRAQDMELADAVCMNNLRARIGREVSDPAVVETLTPWFRFFCKRPTFSDRYLPTFNRDNVTLLDTKGLGVERITANGLVVDGKEYPVDCIVFATGFEVGTDYTRRAEVEIVGRGGLPLSKHWAEDFKTLHGVTTYGFPNLFFMGPAQGPGDVNYTNPIELQAKYVARILGRGKQQHAEVIEVTEEAVDKYVQHFREMALDNQDFYRDCTPGYFNNEGNPSKFRGFLSQRYGGGFAKYKEMTQNWLDDGMPGLEFKGKA